MNKYEIIFSVLIVIAYIISSLTLKIPSYVHLMFGSVILGILLIIILFKLKQKYYSEKNKKTFKIVMIMVFICYIITFLFEDLFTGPLFVPSVIFMIILVIAEVIFLLDD